MPLFSTKKRKKTGKVKKRDLPSPDEADCILLCVVPIKIKEKMRKGA